MKLTKIYLADDDFDDKEFFRLAADETGLNYELITFNDGEQLLTELNKNTQYPDLIFLDINMPKVNGLDCLKKIKQISKCIDLRVVMLSTSTHRPTIENCYQHDASAYIQKPSQVHLLKQYIHYCISGLSDKPAFENFILNNKVLSA